MARNINNLPIGAVERETGIGKDSLRKWELRYAFPQPGRNAAGERVYPPEQVERLRLVKQLIDTGLRPGQVVPLDKGALTALIEAAPTPRAGNPTVNEIMATIAAGDPLGVRGVLAHHLLRCGLESFVLDILKPVVVEVGDSWSSGRLPVHAEHMFTETTQSLLRQAIAAIPAPADRRTVILSTPPGELHGLGILMIQALAAIRGLRVVSLGTQLPVEELVGAARIYNASVVGLSFSVCYPSRRIAPILRELEARLPPDVEIWAGGGGIARAGELPAGVRPLSCIVAALKELGRLAYVRRPRPPQVDKDPNGGRIPAR